MNAAPALRDRARAEAALARGARLWVGYSGGLDSGALLHALAQAFPARVAAIHVHHGLQAEADAWAGHCGAACAALRVPLAVRRVAVDREDAAGPEAAARRARYRAFSEVLKAGDVLALAHHRRDQAETVLLRLFRGSGVSGLAAMPAWIERQGLLLWRPWLEVPRTRIEAYARRHGLAWIEDPQNADPRYARALLRHRLLPLAQTLWPNAEAAVARAARHAAEAQGLLDELAALDLERVLDAGRPSISAALGLTAPRRRNVLRAWLRSQGLEAPDSATLARIDRELLQARADAQPALVQGDATLRRYRDHLYLSPSAPPPRDWRTRWTGAAPLRLPAGCGTLRLDPAAALFDLQVRMPAGGERLRPIGAAHTRTLKNLFQESATPPWERARTPLLWSGDRLLAVGDRWLSAELAAQLASAGARLLWQREAPLAPGCGDVPARA